MLKNACGKCWYHHIFYISVLTGTEVSTFDNTIANVLCKSNCSLYLLRTIQSECCCPPFKGFFLILSYFSFVHPLGHALCCHAASVWNDTIFLSGGFNSQYQCLSSMTLYHPERGSINLAEMTLDRALHCMETLGDRLYVAGGVSCEADGHLVDQLACEVYDPVANSWSAIMPFPVPHVGSASAVLEGKVYVIGGYCQEDYSDTKTVHRYDPATERWENMSVTPGPNTYIAACVLPIPAHLRQ